MLRRFAPLLMTVVFAGAFARPADDAPTPEPALLIEETVAADDPAGAAAQVVVPEALPPAPPSVLSADDRARYARIFDLQERGRFSEAAKIVAEVEDKSLEGWVLWQKLMHPTAYRSRYTELKGFMEAHADHPYADDIYRLSLYRRPKNWRRPPPPDGREWRRDPEDPLPPALAASYDLSPSKLRAVKRVEGRMRYLLRRDRPTQALRELNYRSNRRRLADVQYDRIRSWIAASYFYNGLYDKAEAIAEEVVAANGENAVLASWTAGLIAWRAGDAEEAADHFTAMATVEEQEPSLRAAAAYWAARTSIAAGRADKVVAHLDIADDYPFTFYGLLARHQLGRPIPAPEPPTAPSAERFERLVATSPRVRTAVALAEAGRTEWADLEMRWAMGETPFDLDTDFMAVASAMGLASAEIDIAEDAYARSGAREFEKGLYPVPDLAPAGAYTIDRALAFALMRQESRFRADARSRAGARGLMQLMPRTASYIAKDRTYVYRSGRGRRPASVRRRGNGFPGA
ncbi:MAG: lytic transglycosylase domain-containing protein, partial [Pseudomonadota bacterium]